MSEEFGERLKKCLKEAGYTQLKATEELQLSKNAILNYTKGRIPEANILHALSKLCNVSMEYLLTGKSNFDKLTEKEINLLEKYNLLDHENKIKVEGYIDSKIEEQNNLKKIRDRKNLA